MSAPIPRTMGVINVTPDSFSGDGILTEQDYVARALDQAAQMIADGAALLDIGGESSRPGSAPVSGDEELRRVVPVIKAIKQNFPDVTLAIDTVKSQVAESALQAGAAIVNDITALAGDPRMAEISAKYKAQVVLMHNRASAHSVSKDAKIGGQYDAPDYGDIIADVKQDLQTHVTHALQAGIARDKIILDPGIGFGKTQQQNLILIMRLHQIKELGFPILMGVSRKSFIGHLLDLPVDDRIEGTAACVAACVLHGADILRVHDVKFMSRVVKMAAILRDAEHIA